MRYTECAARCPSRDRSGNTSLALAQYRSSVAQGGCVASPRRFAMNNTSSRQYRERLIDEVKKYPVLYDTRHENHRDIDVRDRCWLEISERLGANSEVLKREWKILRDSMRQALKRSKRGATTKAGTPCKKWQYQSRMAFVLPYMTMRRNQRHPVREKADETETQSDQEPEIWEPSNENLSGDNDALDLFFASVCQSTKRLSKKYQAVLKRQVLDALLRVEEEYENEHAENKEGVNKNFD